MTSKELFDLMSRFEASTIQSMKLTTGDVSIEMSKGGCAAGSAPAAVQAPAAPVAAPAPAAPEGPTITAPLVGIYYAAPAPDQPPFVSAGDRVKKGQTLCLIEAMKMISEIPAPCDCVIEEVLKANGELAAFEEPLFRYRPC